MFGTLVMAYTTSGNYTVTLLATNNCSSGLTETGITVVVAPTASFSGSTTSGCGPLVVQFNDQSSGTPNEWSWQFPGGEPNASNEQNPQVTYNLAGTYEVTLTVTNQAGENAFTLTDYITVNPIAVV